jgi:hypothetical protein
MSTSKILPLLSLSLVSLPLQSNELQLKEETTPISSERASTRRLKYQLSSTPRIAQQNIQAFREDFGWDAIFRPNWVDGVDATVRRLRTDLEVDDAEQFMQLLLSWDESVKKTGFAPEFQIVCSEGTDETIQKKILTLKAILCHMVACELVDEAAIEQFHFFAEAPSDAGREKEKGYENIHTAALDLVREPAAAALFQKLSQTQAPSVNEMYAKSAPRIVEIVIAPITGFVKHYTAHPEELAGLELTGYGSVNIGEGIHQLGDKFSMKIVEDLLNQAHKVFLYEAYPATRIQVGQNDQMEPIYVDFNRMGYRDAPEVFAPLLSERRSAIQAFIIAAKLGWSLPVENKFKNTIAALQNGESFLEELKNKIQTQQITSEKEAFELASQRLGVLGDNTKGCIRILTNMWLNDCIQGTISDLGVAELLAHPEIIEPSCLHTAHIELQVVKGRINTIFVEDPALPHHYAILSKPEERISGVNLEALKRSIHDFYERLNCN